jgi:EAL domain-containing protein (putative c-di-GMP-specific phosphodiesterase class I)
MNLYPTPPRCSACKDGVHIPFPFSMAFQPIVDMDTSTVFAYEALVRGPAGQGAPWVLDQVTEENRYAFDQNCRVQALRLAAQVGIEQTGALLSINFMPGAVYSAAACIQLTLKTAREIGFPCDRLIFEMTEHEEVTDRNKLREIAAEYQSQGFKIAIDDFGAGFSGLNLLADFPCDIIKLDMALTRGLDHRPRALKIVRHAVALASSLGTIVVAEGIETLDELLAVRDCGISLMQGYLFARPAFEALPSILLPGSSVRVPPVTRQSERRQGVDAA